MSPISAPRSNALNLIRWGSAFLVLIGHAEMTSQMLLGSQVDRSNAAWTYLSAHSHIAVMFFFVLSGYLIGYAVHRRTDSSTNYGFNDYFLDRWSRIYSVMIVAIVLTLTLDAIGSAFSGNYKLSRFVPQDRFLVRVVVNILSLQGIMGNRVQLGTNPALWSIGYEFCYYMVFGLIYFKTNIFRNSVVKYSALILIALVAGINMVAYFAIWMLGYLVFWLRHMRGIRLPAMLGIPLIVGVATANHYLAYDHQVPEFVSDFVIAVLFGALLLCDVDGLKPRFASLNAWLADFSYSIYAFHMPIMYFWYSVLPAHFHLSLGALESGILLCCVSMACARLLYHLSEARRTEWRRCGAFVLKYLSGRFARLKTG